jgi:RNA polymerase sigma factor (sigma-70 family)
VYREEGEQVVPPLSSIREPLWEQALLPIIENACRWTLARYGGLPAVDFFLDEARQTAWSKLLEQADTQPEKWIDDLRAYAWTVARNISRELLRRHARNRKKDVSLDDIGEVAVPDSSSPQDDNTSVLEDRDIDVHVQRLKVFLPKDRVGRRRRKVLDYARQNKKPREIARIIGCSLSVVSKDRNYLLKLATDIEESYAEFTTLLSEREQFVLQRALDDMQQKEIAGCLGIAASQLSEILERIREKFATFLKPQPPNGGGA